MLNRLNGCTTVKQGMEMLAAKAPTVYYLNGSRIEPMLAKRLPVMAVSHGGGSKDKGGPAL